MPPGARALPLRTRMIRRTVSPLALALTPAGHLALRPGEPADTLPEAAARRIAAAFARGHGAGLLHLGTSETRTVLPPSAAFWRDLGHAFVAALCAVPDLEAERERAEPAPRPGELERLASEAPPMPGGEYLTPAVLRALWAELLEAWRAEIAGTGETVQVWLAARDPAWSVVGRVHLHLAENRRDDDTAVRLPRHLHHRAGPERKAAAPGPARRGPGGLVELGPPPVAGAAPAGAARRRAEPARQGPGRLGPALPAAGLDGGRGAPLPQGDAGAGGERRHRPGPGLVERPLRAPAAGHGHGRRARAGRAGRGRAARLRRPAHARRRGGDRGRAGRAAGPARRAGALQGALDRGRSREAGRAAAALAAGARGRRRGALVRGGDAAPGRGRARRRRTRPCPSTRSGPGSGPVPGSPRCWPRCGASRASPRPIPAKRSARARSGPTRRRASAGCGSCPGSGWARASPTTWGWARPSRCWRCCCCSSGAAPCAGPPSWSSPPRCSPTGGPSWRASRPRSACWSPTRRPRRARRWRRSPRPRSQDQDLLIISYGMRPPAAVAPRTSFGLVVLDEAQADQEPGRAPDAGGQGLARARSRVALTGTPVENRARRSVVALRLPVPGPARLGAASSASSLKRPGRGGADGALQRYGPLRALVRPYILRRLKTDRSVIARPARQDGGDGLVRR